MPRYIFTCILIATLLAVYVDAQKNEENIRCEENERPYICGSLCEPSCDAPHPNRIFCPRIECTWSLTGGCRCEQGYLRNNNGVCVPSSQC
ncbi:chymotrypsin inhibitor-like [Apis laboriosa]|uniref:chymotrypsin inhibitor-like n=1 Tax=Apis laboriosa TaxID=183418 RepID=UPI001CC5D1A8|nr:chymotrypsin inhibitor-like [Apis laboriosa]